MKGFKMSRFGLLVLLAASLLFAFTACGTGKGDGADKPLKVLYFEDFTHGDAIAGVLDNFKTKVTKVTNFVDLDNAIASGKWDLIILMNQNNDHDFTSVTNLVTYLALGGKVIFANYDSSDTGSFAMFGAIPTGNTNQTLVHISNDTLASGVMNPLTLTNAGWGIFSVGMTPDTANGYWSAAEFGNGDDAVIFSADQKTAVVGWLNDAIDDEASAAAFYENVIRMVLN